MRARPVVLAAVTAALAITLAGAPAAATPGAPAVRVTALDQSTRAQSRIVDDTTVVSRVRDEAEALRLSEPLQLRVVESGGDRVVLATPLAKGADTYRPGGRTSTRLVVADLRAGTSRGYDLPRNVEPEAFGVGPARDLLFVVDHRPANDPTSYRVGAVNLTNGTFQNLNGPTKLPLTIDMTGTAHQQVLSANGNQLYTLYVDHAHDDEAAAGTAFVHVLDLAAGWAYCVDLPGVGHGPAGSSTLRLDPTGTALLVTDRHAHTTHTIRTRDLTVERLVQGPPAVATGRARSPE
jgi:hypothetical protein